MLRRGFPCSCSVPLSIAAKVHRIRIRAATCAQCACDSASVRASLAGALPLGIVASALLVSSSRASCEASSIACVDGALVTSGMCAADARREQERNVVNSGKDSRRVVCLASAATVVQLSFLFRLRIARRHAGVRLFSASTLEHISTCAW